MKLSIIIPIYNVEKYLVQCLDSALGEDLQKDEFEVVAVNDGSPDASGQILKEYEKQYANFIVVNKSNGGLSSARNAGLDVAKGKFVWFVDGDDWVKPDISSIFSYLDKHGEFDVVALNAITVKENGDFIKRINRPLFDGLVYDGLSIYKSLSFPFSGVPFYLWKRSFLQENKLRFKEGALYDDWQFTLRAFAVMKECVCLQKAVYCYRLRDNTISNASKSFRHLHDCVETAADYSMCLENASLSSRTVFMLNSGICKMIADAYKIMFLRIKNKDERKRCLAYFFSKSFWLDAVFCTKSYKSLIYYMIIRVRGGVGL